MRPSFLASRWKRNFAVAPNLTQVAGAQRRFNPRSTGKGRCCMQQSFSLFPVFGGTAGWSPSAEREWSVLFAPVGASNRTRESNTRIEHANRTRESNTRIEHANRTHPDAPSRGPGARSVLTLAQVLRAPLFKHSQRPLHVV